MMFLALKRESLERVVLVKILKIEHMSKVFNPNTINENKVFDDFSLEVDKGDFVTIIGSNGAGKSTLLNIIAGSITEDSGKILINNEEVSNKPEYKRAKSIGRVFQNPSVGVSPNMTILENMSLADNKGKRFGLTSGINKKKIDEYKEMLKRVDLGLEDKLFNKVQLLSGGQRQALTLLMATLRAEPTHKQIIKDYVTFSMGDKEKAREEVTSAYNNAFIEYKGKIKEISKQKGLGFKEKRNLKKQYYKEFDEKVRKYDLTKQILLLDEQTAALDPKTARKVLELTEKIVRENQMTTLMITHNMKDAITYGDRLIMFYEGHIIHDIKGAEKKKLTVEQLLKMFDEAERNSVK